MTRLTFLILAVAGPTLMGILVIAALTMGLYSVRAIVTAAVVGALIALPVSWVVARRITGRG